MKTYTYTIHFKVGGPVKVNASSRKEALILALAEKIKKGLDTSVSSITDEDGTSTLIRSENPMVINYV